jgi:3-deoxy-D-manno-octulosonic-acid transferase
MDYSESYFWYRVVSAGEVKVVTPEQLKKLQDIIATHLTPEALSRVQERAREWISGHPAN